MEYSKELIEECKNIFKEEHGVEFTDEQANEALENLSGLFLALAKKPTSEEGQNPSSFSS
jgi:preprotein translocase subunit Sss1